MGVSGGKTLGDFVDGRTNNFDALRLFAALLVLVAHSFALAGEGIDSLIKILGGYRPTSIGVYIFFIISGFLVTGSIQRRSLPEYIAGRVFRIIPALTVTVFVTALVVGPIFTELSVGEYFGNDQVYKYLFNSIPYSIEFTWPGLFTDLPFANGVNGSLWTLPIESLCYVVLAGIYLLGFRTVHLMIPACLVVALLVLLNGVTSVLDGRVLFGTTMLSSSFQYGLMFGIGASMWALRYRIAINDGWAIASVGVLFIGSITGFVGFFVYVGLPYLVMFCAYRRPILQRFMANLGDLSYGTYLFAFPIQQVIVYTFSGEISGLSLAVISGVVSMGLAWCSWRVIESPAMKFKSRLFYNAGSVNAL